jgi:hypothetical protein
MRKIHTFIIAILIAIASFQFLSPYWMVYRINLYDFERPNWGLVPIEGNLKLRNEYAGTSVFIVNNSNDSLNHFEGKEVVFGLFDIVYEKDSYKNPNGGGKIIRLKRDYSSGRYYVEKWGFRSGIPYYEFEVSVDSIQQELAKWEY